LLIVVVGLAVLGLVLIVFAPWRKVREEKPLPPDVETRLLLGEPPDAIASEADERPGGAPPAPDRPAPPTAG
jgi:hypothetical protein